MIHEMSSPNAASIDPEITLKVEVLIPPDSWTALKLPNQLANKKNRNK
jgi:hypothetical protein